MRKDEGVITHRVAIFGHQAKRTLERHEHSEICRYLGSHLFKPMSEWLNPSTMRWAPTRGDPENVKVARISVDDPDETLIVALGMPHMPGISVPKLFHRAWMFGNARPAKAARDALDAETIVSVMLTQGALDVRHSEGVRWIGLASTFMEAIDYATDVALSYDKPAIIERVTHQHDKFFLHLRHAK